MALFKKKNDGAALNSVLVRRPIQKCFPIFLLPTFIAFCIGFLYPFANGLFLSFCNFKTTSKWTWAGLDNYVKAFADESVFGGVAADHGDYGFQYFQKRVLHAQPDRRHRPGLYLVHDF